MTRVCAVDDRPGLWVFFRDSVLSTDMAAKGRRRREITTGIDAYLRSCERLKREAAVCEEEE